VGWLAGWDQRIKLTIDHDKVDTGLSWFPVTVFLDSTHGDCVFDELVADGNRFKIAFTKADGETELYGEIQKWDDGSEIAIIHVSRDGWAISDSGDTDFYMYYDVGHADNTTYIGDINSTPGAAVWDDDFIIVHHMVVATTSTIIDRTSNEQDGTKKAANSFVSAIGTAEVFFKSDWNHTDNLGHSFFSVFGDSGTQLFHLDKDTDNRIYGGWYNNAEYRVTPNSALYTISSGNQYYAVLDWNDTSNDTNFYLDLALIDSNNTLVTFTPTEDFRVGNRTDVSYPFDGIIDEFRLSDAVRASAWSKATSNSLRNTLLTYGSEELDGTVCWGHDTGVVEANIRDYTGNWTGTGIVSGAGDAELIGLQTGEYMESEDWHLGSCIFNSARLRQNVYDVTGDDVTLKYKTAATKAALPGTGWSVYAGAFQSLGWVKVRIER
jgi:hypothetical protein